LLGGKCYATLPGVFHVGDLIRKLREQRGLGVVDLAKKAGLDKGTISKVENGKPVSAETLERIATALGLDRPSSLLLAWAQHDAGRSATETRAEAKLLPLVRRLRTAKMLNAAEEMLLSLLAREEQELGPPHTTGSHDGPAPVAPPAPRATSPRTQKASRRRA
jgi:transcriptional regulator with XRE-family HTH domain